MPDSPLNAAAVVAIVGPTAAGKSALATRLALRIGGEIVNADAMQLYRGMDIGTAKASAAERAAVPHHCLDIWDVAEPASVKEYRDLARAIVVEVWDRGRIPLVVGGSWLYVRAVCDVLEIPPRDAGIRAELVAELAAVGPETLHARLAELDPAAASGILPGNGRRIVRALEVISLTGRYRAVLPEPHSWHPTLWLGVTRPRPELDDLIAQRVARMWESGLIEETRRLISAGLLSGPTACKAVGYSQAIGFIEGEMTQAEAQAETVRATKRLARRQDRTFRADTRVKWLDGCDHDRLEEAADLLQRWRESGSTPQD
ncbi:MAG: tRNA (adenosine(37)-N6)-dimethylallyltransferase MiaA [Candidatus Nanopelagicales bacterium]|nr:tRNA (adenosine(37)-N6)-dimethylallyltransferase MiaA [Candidatus Nanopelagicales bacterium]MDZ4250645.1 tRNA (adenosine(37)-N6)-dimethylallyltransferase MiaA [Candidatus Nanopelagicales bacterium]